MGLLLNENIPVLKGNYLEGKNIVITGGTSGIGLAIARLFLNNGCNKLLITSRSKRRLEETIKLLHTTEPNSIGRIEGAPLRLDNVNGLNNDFLNIVDSFEPFSIDIWINNAGIYKGTRFGDVKEYEWDELLNVNLKSQYFLSQIVSNYMIEKGIRGNICNICSSSSFRPSIDPYMISKLGMSGLTLGMAKKLISHGIVVNGIAPGPTFTPMLKKKDGDSLKHGGVPAGRYILPEEVANLALFLTSSMGRMIIGDVVKITGGSAVTTFDDVKY